MSRPLAAVRASIASDGSSNIVDPMRYSTPLVRGRRRRDATSTKSLEVITRD